MQPVSLVSAEARRPLMVSRMRRYQWRCTLAQFKSGKITRCVMVNVGGVDRGLRIVAGAALVLLSFVGPVTETLYPWGLIGIVPLVTGLIGWCPAYSIFRIKTCR
jgi:hypothetical protein